MMHVHDVVAAHAAMSSGPEDGAAVACTAITDWAAGSTKRSSASLASLQYVNEACDVAAPPTPALRRKRSDVTSDSASHRKHHATPRNSGSAAAPSASVAATPPPQADMDGERRAAAGVADGGDGRGGDDNGSSSAGFGTAAPVYSPPTRDDDAVVGVAWCRSAEEEEEDVEPRSSAPVSGRRHTHTPLQQRDARCSLVAVPGTDVMRTAVRTPSPSALTGDALAAAAAASEAPLVAVGRRRRGDTMPETPTRAVMTASTGSDSPSVSSGHAFASVISSALHSTAETQWPATSAAPTVSGIAELYELPLPFSDTTDDLTVVSSLTASSFSAVGAVGGSVSPFLGKPRAAVCASPAAAAEVGPTRNWPSIIVPVSMVRPLRGSAGLPHGVVKLAERPHKRSSDDSTQRSDKSAAASAGSRFDSHGSTGGELSLQAPLAQLEGSGMWSAGTGTSPSTSVRRVETAATPSPVPAPYRTPPGRLSPAPLFTTTRTSVVAGASVSLTRNGSSLDSHVAPGARVGSLPRLGGQSLSPSCRGTAPSLQLAEPLDADGAAQSTTAASGHSLLSGSNSLAMPLFLSGSTASLAAFAHADNAGATHTAAGQAAALPDARQRSMREVDDRVRRLGHALPSLLAYTPQRGEPDLERPPLSPHPAAGTPAQLMSPVTMTAPPISTLRPSPSITSPPERFPDGSDTNATPPQLHRLQSSSATPPTQTPLPPSQQQQQQRVGRPPRRHTEMNAFEGASLNSLSGPRPHSLRNFTVTSTASFGLDNPGSANWQRSRGGAPSLSLQDSAISMWQSSTLLSDHILQTLAHGMALGGISAAPWQAATATAAVAEDNVTTPAPNALTRNAAADLSSSSGVTAGKGHGLPRSFQHHHHGGSSSPTTVVTHSSHRHARLHSRQFSPVSTSASSNAHGGGYGGQSGSPYSGSQRLATSLLVPLVHRTEMPPRLGGGSRSRTPYSRACSLTGDRDALRASSSGMWPLDVHTLRARHAGAPSTHTHASTPASRGAAAGFPTRSPMSTSRATSCTTTGDSTATADSPSSAQHLRTPWSMLAANASAMAAAAAASSAGAARLGAGAKSSSAAAPTSWSRRPVIAGNFFATADGSLRDAGAMSAMSGVASLSSGLQLDRSLVTPVRGYNFVRHSTANSRAAATSASHASLSASPPLGGCSNGHGGPGARGSAVGLSLLSQAPLGQEGVMFFAVATPNLVGGYAGDSLPIPTPSAPTAIAADAAAAAVAYGTASPPTRASTEQLRGLRWPARSEAIHYRFPSNTSSGGGGGDAQSAADGGVAGQAAPLHRVVEASSTFLQSVHDVGAVAAQANTSASFSYGTALQRLLAAGAVARGAAAAAGAPSSASPPQLSSFLAPAPSRWSCTVTSAAAAVVSTTTAGSPTWPRGQSTATRGSMGADSSLAMATAVPSSSRSETPERTTGVGAAQVSQPVVGSGAVSPADATLAPATTGGTAAAAGVEALVEEPRSALGALPACLTTEPSAQPSSASIPTFAPRQGSSASNLAATIRSLMPGFISVRDRLSARLSDVTGSAGLPVLPLAEEERTKAAGMSLSCEPGTPTASRPSSEPPLKKSTLEEQQQQQHSQWWAPIVARAAAAFSSPVPELRPTPLYTGVEAIPQITPPEPVRASASGYPLPLPQRPPRVDTPLTVPSGSAVAFSASSGSRGIHPLASAPHDTNLSIGSGVGSATPCSAGGSSSSALGRNGGGGGEERTEARGQSRRANRGTLFHRRGTLFSANSGSPTGGLHAGGGGGGPNSNGVVGSGPRGGGANGIHGSPNGDGRISIPRYRRHHDVEALLDDAERAMNRTTVPIISVLGVAGWQQSNDASPFGFPDGGPVASILSIATPPMAASTMESDAALLSPLAVTTTPDKGGTSAAALSLSTSTPARQ